VHHDSCLAGTAQHSTWTIPATSRVQVPAVLEVPRMELWFTLVLLQPIGQACGSASHLRAQNLVVLQSRRSRAAWDAPEYAMRSA